MITPQFRGRKETEVLRGGYLPKLTQIDSRSES